MRSFIVAFGLLMGTSAFAAHGPSGCGLGSVLFKGQSGLLMHVLAATTNGSSANQTFGMSTGTLGCEDVSSSKIAAVDFIEGNRQSMINDVALGGGDTLNAYLAIIDRPQANVAVLQTHFSQIFASEKSAENIHSSILAVL